MSNPIDLKIARVETFPIALPTLADFAVSGGSVARAGEPSIRVLVKVTADDCTFGWGEATPIPSWTYETLESITSTIDRYLAPVAMLSSTRSSSVWPSLRTRRGAVRCAHSLHSDWITTGLQRVGARKPRCTTAGTLGRDVPQQRAARCKIERSSGVGLLFEPPVLQYEFPQEA